MSPLWPRVTSSASTAMVPCSQQLTQSVILGKLSVFFVRGLELQLLEGSQQKFMSTAGAGAGGRFAFVLMLNFTHLSFYSYSYMS